MFETDLKGKNVIVTGGSSGLCKEIAKAYNLCGCNVVIISSSSKVIDAAKEISTDDNIVQYVQADLTDFENISIVVEKCLKKLNNRIDVLLNGAGMIKRKPFLDVDLKDWQKVIDLNLNAIFVISQLVARLMVKQKFGRIINIASMDSFFGSVLVASYSASKGGLALLTKAMSNELCSLGVTVNAIAPGYMETELTKTMKIVNPEQYKEITNRIPIGRWGKPNDLTGLALFLSSSGANYITGAIIPVDGGFMAK